MTTSTLKNTSTSKLDALVKACIMRHPSIFPSRIEVLEHLFLVNGNDYEWNLETGDIEDAFGRDMYQHPEKIDSTEINEASTDNYLRTQYVALKHQFIEEHIDEIATDTIAYHTCEIDIHRMSRHFSKDYSLLGQILKLKDITQINRVWRDGILELAAWYIQKTRGFYSLYALKDSSKELNYIDSDKVKNLFLLFKSLNVLLLNREEYNTLTKERKKQEAFVNRMIDEILQEEKEKKINQ